MQRLQQAPQLRQARHQIKSRGRKRMKKGKIKRVVLSLGVLAGVLIFFIGKGRKERNGNLRSK